MRLLFADGLFWSSVACCLVAQLFILRSVLGAQQLASPAAGMPRRRGALEIVWAIVPAVALAILLTATWRAVHARAVAPASASAEGVPA